MSERSRIRDHVLELADSDDRIVAGAVVGSMALNDGDRWSDLDLTFAVADNEPLMDVLHDWTGRLVTELDAVRLFDLPSGPSIYRVFLLPGCLQFDLSFTPASQFGSTGPNFRLLFGAVVEREHTEPPSLEELFGFAVHHALRARFCIERRSYWQAEYWISGVRDYALSLACRRQGLSPWYGRGYDDLPPEVHNAMAPALIRSLDRDELLRALGVAIAALLEETVEIRTMAAKIEPQLIELSRPWDTFDGQP